MAEIRPATNADIPLHLAHFDRHRQESGQDGDLIFMPEQTKIQRPPIADETVRIEKQWNTPVTEIGWTRVWLLHAEGEIRGDLTLTHRPPLTSCLHRATLMMGIERSHRSQGYGRRMLETAIEWATKQPSLDYLQLFVFAQNEPAIKLYQRFGFKEDGRTPDMFRIYGQKITNISMELRLKLPSSRQD